MQEAQIPENEAARQAALESYNIIDSKDEKAFDDLTLIASQICQTPIALVSLIDNDRQWFKSRYGLDITETPRNISFCGHAINEPQKIFEVNNTAEDQRFVDSPLVTGQPNIAFYAGVPLVDDDNLALGTLCVFDREPRTLTQDQKDALKALANEVMNRISLRKKNQTLEYEIAERTSELVASNTKYYTLYHNAPDMMVTIDAINQTIIECNKSTCIKLGYTREEIIGATIFDIYHPDCHDKVRSTFKKFMEVGYVENQKVGLRNKQGEKMFVALNSTAIRDENGKIVSANGIWTDITELEHAEQELLRLNSNLENQIDERNEELRLQKERMELAFKATNDGLWDWLDLEGNDEWWSPRFHQLLGYEVGEIEPSLSTFADFLLHEEDKEKTQAAVEACIAEGKAIDIEYRLRTKSGDFRWFRGRGDVKRDSLGKARRMVGSISDIHRRKRLELELLNQTIMLEQQNEDLKQFAHLATHDLRSPLISIQGHFNYLKSQFENPTGYVAESIAFIDSDVRRFNDTLSGLTAAIKLKEGIVTHEPVHLKHVFDEITPNYKTQIEKIGGSLELKLEEDLQVNGTKIYVCSILQNLISNAIKYRDEKRKFSLKVFAERIGEKISITVEDNGLGIDLGLHQDKLFKMFNRFHDQAEGHGMGLYLVKVMVEKLGGSINIDSTPNVGTKFTIKLSQSHEN